MVVAGLSSITKITRTLDDQRGGVWLRNRSGDDYCNRLLAKERFIEIVSRGLRETREKSIIPGVRQAANAATERMALKNCILGWRCAK